MTIGAKIRNMRTLKNYSQDNMAEMLGISLNAYSKIEREETNVQYARLEQIAEVLKVSILELLSFGEGGMVYINGNVSNGSAGTGTIINSTKEEVEILVELMRLRTENEGFKKEITHLNSIISLLQK
ncbi:MAG: hypothetical protein RI894_1351 [Bacteroidota bacterium]|jgi:transcriptional regulator with XRE-family HTH domain